MIWIILYLIGAIICGPIIIKRKADGLELLFGQILWPVYLLFLFTTECF